MSVSISSSHRAAPRGLFFAFITALTLATAADADAKLARNGGAQVSFTAVGPGGMKIVGTTSDLEVSDDGAQVAVNVPLANLTTGIALRDKHMREKYLQVQTYPKATLKFARADVKLPAGGGEQSGDAAGTMSIHGKDQKVTVHYRVKRDGDVLDVNGTVHVNMKDHGIEVPSYLGVTVKPDVDVAVHFNVKDG